MPEYWFKQLPLDQLIINHLSINTETNQLVNKFPILNSSNTLLSFKGNLAANKESLKLKGEYFENDQLIASSDLQVFNHNAFNFSSVFINANDKQRPFRHKIEGIISKDSQSLVLAATQQIQLANFNTASIWAKPLFSDQLKAQIKSITAKATLSHTLSLTQSDDSSLNLNSLQNQFDIQGVAANPDQLFSAIPLKITSGKFSIKGALTKANNEMQLSITPTSNIVLLNLRNKDISTNEASFELIKPFNLSCQLPCNIVGSLQKHASTLSPITVDVAATDWTIAHGKISHQPLTLKVTVLDLIEPALSVSYKDLAVKFSTANRTPESTNALPFSMLSLHSNGKLTWQDQLLFANITAPLSIEASNVHLAGSSTEKFKLSMNKDLALKIIPEKQSVIIDQANFSIANNTWQLDAGKLQHADIQFQLSNLNLLKQQGMLRVKSPSVTLKAKKLPFRTLQTQLALSAELKDKMLELDIDKGININLSKLSLDSVSAKKLRVNNKKAIKIKLPIDFNDPQLDITSSASSAIISPMHFTISASPIKVDKQKVRFQYATLKLHSIKLSPFKAHATSTIKSLQTYFPKLDKAWQTFDIKASHWANKTRYDAKISLENPALALKAKADIKAVKGFKNLEANWQFMPFSLNLLTINRLRKITDQWPEQLQIVDGQYSNKGFFTKRGAKLSAKVTHQITDASLLRDKLLTSGVNLQSQTQYRDNKLSQSGKLSITNINSPVPISGISTEFTLNDLLTKKPKMSLRRLGADLLGTRVKVNQLVAQLTPLSTRGVIEFSKLPLNNILELENQPSLNGEGLLQGKLPFRLQDKSLWIDKGRINSMGNGVIRYQMNDKIRALASSNQGLAIAVNVLENFKYQSLDITANYSPDGKLLLANRLKGQNPNWQNGQPIDFSINIEENILKLLKTLQFTDELEEKLQEKVQGQIPSNG